MSRLMRRPRLLALVIALVGVALIGGGSVVLAATVKSGKAVTAVRTVTESAPALISTESDSNFPWIDIPGMSTSMSVPLRQRALLLVTFSASTACYDITGAPSTFCYVRVLVDGTETPPGSVIFRDAQDGNGAYGANSMQFVAGPLNAGSHMVKVQARMDQPLSHFDFTDRTLTVLRSRV